MQFKPSGSSAAESLIGGCAKEEHPVNCVSYTLSPGIHSWCEQEQDIQVHGPFIVLAAAALHILRRSFVSFSRTCELFCWEDSDRADERGQDLEHRGLCFQTDRASECSYCSLASAERSVPATSQ